MKILAFMQVVVDDLIPCGADGRPIFGRCVHPYSELLISFFSAYNPPRSGDACAHRIGLASGFLHALSLLLMHKSVVHRMS